jgi:hypothetical protein
MGIVVYPGLLVILLPPAAALALVLLGLTVILLPPIAAAALVFPLLLLLGYRLVPE